MFLEPGPDRDVRASSSSSASRSGCSGRAGACARGPSASIRRPPRRSASTSSGSATGTSCIGGVLAGLARRLPEHGGDQLVPGRHDRRPRVHRPGGDDRRALDADRRVRRGAALLARRWRSARSITFAPPTGELGDVLHGAARPSSSTRCRTSSRSSSWPGSSAGASRRPPTASRTSARPRPDGDRGGGHGSHGVRRGSPGAPGRAARRSAGRRPAGGPPRLRPRATTTRSRSCSRSRRPGSRSSGSRPWRATPASRTRRATRCGS